MTVARSRPSSLLLSAVAAVLLGFIPGASARICDVDDFGVEHCRASNGVRIGVAIAIVVAGILLIALFSFYRRRRIQRTNLAYVTQAQANPGGYQPNYYGPQGTGAGYPNYQQYYGGGSPGGPQYPPPTHAYGDPQYAPPPGPPPARDGELPPPNYYPSPAAQGATYTK